jgi:hypothetical protein
MVKIWRCVNNFQVLLHLQYSVLLILNLKNLKLNVIYLFSVYIKGKKNSESEGYI